jgi:hypothetical protein
MQMQSQNQSKMEIFTIPKHTYVELECSICYKPIQKAYVRCSAPCKKIFHTSCMDKIIEQTEAAAYEEEREAEHKCCYCRRCIDVNHYALQEVARQLMCLRRGGYDISEAMQKVKKELYFNEDDEDDAFGYYYPLVTSYQKKPKQAKRSAPKKFTKQPRIHLKQNIGGRRRS